MTHVPRRRGWELVGRDASPEPAVLGRREFLRRLGAAGAGIAAGAALARVAWATAAATRASGAIARDPSFAPGGSVTSEALAGTWNNFYELGEDPRRAGEASAALATRPWRLVIDGLVARPRAIDRDELVRRMPPEERVYRHRCVEAWSMTVPWLGVPLGRLLRWAEPLSSARYLRVVSFLRPEQAPNQRRASWFPWPYAEGLRLDEAMHELAFVATGIYGHDLPAAHGAPVRLVLPWKYGLKSAKSVVRLQLTAERPATFWSTVAPDEYGFLSNVNPAVPHPRWSQARERPLGSEESRPTLPYNGYAEWVARLYDRPSETWRS